eukprot:m.132590 g.132590  ORF g.132590 m.132590 type:complete len:178 (-) comp16488_c0_seq3:229-762(-)
MWLVLEGGANVGVSAEDGTSPSAAALRNGHLEVARFLKDRELVRFVRDASATGASPRSLPATPTASTAFALSPASTSRAAVAASGGSLRVARPAMSLAFPGHAALPTVSIASVSASPASVMSPALADLSSASAAASPNGGIVPSFGHLSASPLSTLGKSPSQDRLARIGARPKETFL